MHRQLDLPLAPGLHLVSTGNCLLNQVSFPMAHSRRIQLRHKAFNQQNCKCFYCGFPMWERAVEQFAIAHSISIRQARLLRSTAEHLVAQTDGGLDAPGNIVAACAWCNKRRHAGRAHLAPAAAAYKTHVARRVAAGKWHPMLMDLTQQMEGQLRTGIERCQC
jgi:hypothetical protein